MTNKELQEFMRSGGVKSVDANKIIPSRDLDSYDYNLFLKFASQKELEEDSFTSETFKKIEEYKIQGLEPRVDFIENEETKELEQIVKYMLKYNKKELVK